MITRPEIVRAARSWIGTPYHHRASLKGVGTDCIGLIRGLWRELVGEEPEALPAYSGDWAEATGQEAMLATARRHFVTTSADRIREGDVLVFRLRAGTAAKHTAIVAEPGRMIHAQEGVPVSEVSLGPWWRRRIAGAFKLPGVVD